MENSEGLMYYYSINGTVYGPLPLAKLLEKIDADTLVFREGIEWTNATEVEELKKFFKKPNLEKANKKIVSSASAFDDLNKASTFDDLNKASAYDDSTQNDVYVEPQKMFTASFSFNGRIRRMEYAVSFLIYLGAVYFLEDMIKSSSTRGFIFIPLLWFLWAQGAKRCHDRGNSGWWQLIPFYVFWMMFAEGDNEENEYGFPPKN
jgi:uncharacterized membrane protein YhaH (DUF805 family)